MIAIKLNKTNRYVAFSDDCWYDATPYPRYLYKDREEAMNVIQQMHKHYQYYFTLEYDDDTPSEEICTLKKQVKKQVSKMKLGGLNINKLKIKMKI